MNCRHAGVCGGCSLLHLPYDGQLRLKQQRLIDLLAGSAPVLARRAGSVFLPVPGQSDSPARFRQKAAFVFGAGTGGRGFVMGHFAPRSRTVVPVSECPVHGDRANRIAFALRDHLARAGISAAGVPPNGTLRHLIVRTTADEREAVAMLVVTRNDRSLRAPVRAWLGSPDRPDGFFVNVNTEDGPFMVGERTLHLTGLKHVREEVGGVSYLISPTAFFQTNVEAAGVLQRHVVDSVRGAARVLDLYCGSGLFSLPLAAGGAAVTGVEENGQATADAEANARLNRVPRARARFVAARVEDAVHRLAREPWDAVILDPPRQGCSDEVLQAVFVDLAPPRVTYVSCNPEALAAELPGILDCGYRVDDIRAVDMFPHTEHIETVVTLRAS